MNVRLGFALATDRVRVVAVRGEAVVWAGEAEVDGPEAIAAAVAELLAAAPLPRWRRPVASAAIGPAGSQVKKIGGLPPLTDPLATARLVQENAGRFFLRNSIPLVVTGIRILEPGRVWAAALEEPLARAAESACRAARLRLRAIAPAAVTLGAALENDRILWQDGPVCVEVLRSEGRLMAVRRIAATELGGKDDLRPVAALATVDDRAWRFADAYGAAVMSFDEPLVFQPRRGKRGPGSVPRWRIALAAAALATAVAAALLAPGLVAERRGRTAGARIAALAAERGMAILAENQLKHLTDVLGAVAAFDSTRQSLTLLLGELTVALPDGTAMVTLRVDSAGGTLVALGPVGANVAGALEQAGRVTGVEIVGPVTRETIGTGEVARITLRFGLVDARRLAKSDSSAGAPR